MYSELVQMASQSTRDGWQTSRQRRVVGARRKEEVIKLLALLVYDYLISYPHGEMAKQSSESCSEQPISESSIRVVSVLGNCAFDTLIHRYCQRRCNTGSIGIQTMTRKCVLETRAKFSCSSPTAGVLLQHRQLFRHS